MERKLSLSLGIIGLLLVTMACAGPSRVERDFGTSAKLAKFNQIANPAAGKNLEPVVGFDGGAAKATIDKYHKDFEKPAPETNVYMIGTSGAIGKK